MQLDASWTRTYLEQGKTLLNQGKVLEELERFEDARVAYAQAVLFYPMDANAHMYLGKVLYALERYEESRDAYKQAIYLDSSKTQAFDQLRQMLMNRGKALFDLGDFEGALVVYTKAISFDPHFKDGYEGKGKTLDKLKRYKEARAAFQAAHGVVSPMQPISQNMSWMYKEPFRYSL